jgi:hypothetical protein
MTGHGRVRLFIAAGELDEVVCLLLSRLIQKGKRRPQVHLAVSGALFRLVL